MTETIHFHLQEFINKYDELHNKYVVEYGDEKIPKEDDIFLSNYELNLATAIAKDCYKFPQMANKIGHILIAITKEI